MSLSLSLSGGQTGGMTEEKCPQLVDYFVVAGLDPAGPWRPLDEDGKSSNSSSSTSSSSSSSSSSSGRAVEPVTDLAVIARGLGEEVPEGFTCIERTLGGHSAELSAGLINNPHLYLCYRRGRDKPPILDIGWDAENFVENFHKAKCCCHVKISDEISQHLWDVLSWSLVRDPQRRNPAGFGVKLMLIPVNNYTVYILIILYLYI